METFETEPEKAAAHQIQIQLEKVGSDRFDTKMGTYEHSMRSIWRSDSIDSIRVINITKGSKKHVNFQIHLNLLQSHCFIVESMDHGKSVTAFRDFTNGLMVANIRKNGNNVQFHSVMQEFQRQVVDACCDALIERIKELKIQEETDPDSYLEIYKPTKMIEREGMETCRDNYLDILRQIKQQIGLMGTMAPCEVNQFLVYQDTLIKNQLSTYRVPYADPAKQTLTPEQKALVENFLSVFVDEKNMHILSWYMGAAVLNVPIYHANVSKMLVVSSAGGGCGKNTLFNSLSQALFSDNYRDIKPAFDPIFDKRNRFGGGEIFNVRYTQYNEAEFAAGDTRDEFGNDRHDFSGLAKSEIKSLICDGYVSRERKFTDVVNNRVSSMQVVLTNHFPDIDARSTDLTRRLLALTIRADRMESKGRRLGLRNEGQVYRYVFDNVQAFANYFADFYLKNPRAYTNLDYDSHAALETITASSDAHINCQRQTEIELRDQIHTDPFHGLAHVFDYMGLDYTDFFNEVKKANDASYDRYIRVEDGLLYISTVKRFYDRFSIPAIRRVLNQYAKTEKKFHGTYFVLGDKDPNLALEFAALCQDRFDLANNTSVTEETVTADKQETQTAIKQADTQEQTQTQTTIKQADTQEQAPVQTDIQEPVVTEPATAESATVEPATVEPVAVEPATVESEDATVVETDNPIESNLYPDFSQGVIDQINNQVVYYDLRDLAHDDRAVIVHAEFGDFFPHSGETSQEYVDTMDALNRAHVDQCSAEYDKALTKVLDRGFNETSQYAKKLFDQLIAAGKQLRRPAKACDYGKLPTYCYDLQAQIQLDKFGNPRTEDSDPAMSPSHPDTADEHVTAEVKAEAEPVVSPYLSDPKLQTSHKVELLPDYVSAIFHAIDETDAVFHNVLHDYFAVLKDSYKHPRQGLIWDDKEQTLKLARREYNLFGPCDEDKYANFRNAIKRISQCDLNGDYIYFSPKTTHRWNVTPDTFHGQLPGDFRRRKFASLWNAKKKAAKAQHKDVNGQKDKTANDQA